MIYAMSDLHGCYDKYIKMLEIIGLRKSDTLYILGDVIDRGPGGIEILPDMMKRPNVKPLLGNHESMALPPMKCIAGMPAFDAALQGTRSYRRWMLNDGKPTERAFRALDPPAQSVLIEYIESFSIYDEITVEGRRFHLSHTLPDYDSNIPIHDVPFNEFIYGEPDYSKVYADDIYFVTGHTPTGLIDSNYTGRIYQKNNHIAIDCGASFGHPLGCVCLDTLEEFYAE